jgi:hypothetical protein
MKLDIEFKYEYETTLPGEDEEATAEVVEEVVQAQVTQFASAVRSELASRGVKDIQMGIGEKSEI